MKTAAATRDMDSDSRETLAVLQTDHTEPLSDCVRKALRFYLANLDGYDIHGLHEMVLTEVERPLLETVLDYTQGNQTQAARMLGMSRSTLRKKIARYGVGGAD